MTRKYSKQEKWKGETDTEVQSRNKSLYAKRKEKLSWHQFDGCIVVEAFLDLVFWLCFFWD